MLWQTKRMHRPDSYFPSPSDSPGSKVKASDVAIAGYSEPCRATNLSVNIESLARMPKELSMPHLRTSQTRERSAYLPGCFLSALLGVVALLANAVSVA